MNTRLRSRPSSESGIGNRSTWPLSTSFFAASRDRIETPMPWMTDFLMVSWLAILAMICSRSARIPRWRSCVFRLLAGAGSLLPHDHVLLLDPVYILPHLLVLPVFRLIRGDHHKLVLIEGDVGTVFLLQHSAGKADVNGPLRHLLRHLGAVGLQDPQLFSRVLLVEPGQDLRQEVLGGDGGPPQW